MSCDEKLAARAIRDSRVGHRDGSGGVIAEKRVVIPNRVARDIGAIIAIAGDRAALNQREPRRLTSRINRAGLARRLHPPEIRAIVPVRLRQEDEVIGRDWRVQNVELENNIALRRLDRGGIVTGGVKRHLGRACTVMRREVTTGLSGGRWRQ